MSKEYRGDTLTPSCPTNIDYNPCQLPELPSRRSLAFLSPVLIGSLACALIDSPPRSRALMGGYARLDGHRLSFSFGGGLDVAWPGLAHRVRQPANKVSTSIPIGAINKSSASIVGNFKRLQYRL